MTQAEQDIVSAVISALQVERNRFGKLEARRNRLGNILMEYRAAGHAVPHGGLDVADQAVMVLQCLIGAPPTSMLDAR